MSESYETATRSTTAKKVAKSNRTETSKKSSPAILLLAVLIIAAGIAADYWITNHYTSISPTVAFLVFVASVVLAGLLALISPQGKAFVKFSRESYKEVRKVVWPSKDETIKTTLLVFVFALVMSLVLWIADLIISWLLYGVVLGWG